MPEITHEIWADDHAWWDLMLTKAHELLNKIEQNLTRRDLVHCPRYDMVASVRSLTESARKTGDTTYTRVSC